MRLIMRFRSLAWLSWLLGLSGCSYHYDIVVVEEADAIVFLPAKKTGTGCFANFSVKDQSGKTVWSVTTARYLQPPCESKFPIIYGAVPRGMTEEVKPAPLQPHVQYKVEGWDGDGYSGAFQFRRGMIVENIPEPKP